MITQRPSDLKLYSCVKEVPVDWLWYPYIPYGKLTLLQGDPGGGKSTFIVNIISAVSSGGKLPDGTELSKPMHVIYQCSEDGAADTIKPRLITAGANCENVAFIDEESTSLTLNDEAIRCAVADFNAKLLVIDTKFYGNREEITWPFISSRRQIAASTAKSPVASRAVPFTRRSPW